METKTGSETPPTYCPIQVIPPVKDWSNIAKSFLKAGKCKSESTNIYAPKSDYF